MATLMLNSYQSTAYWWVLQIKFACKEINNELKEKNSKVVLSKDQIKFSLIFSKYDEKAWRKLYLGLTEQIKAAVLRNPNKALIQGTNYGQHACMNHILSELTEREIPDIKISSLLCKGFEIETTPETATQKFHVFKPSPIGSCFPDCFLLSGNRTPIDENKKDN